MHQAPLTMLGAFVFKEIIDEQGYNLRMGNEP